ncbi:HAD-IA family hydrolase, partial [Prevotella copri]
FDEVFLSYAMRKEKPSIEIYEEMTQKTGLNPATTLYFDDRSENAEAGKRFGFQSVLVKTNHLEEHQEWQEINKKIGLLCLWPFGSTVRETNGPTGCIRIPLNLLWLIFGGLWACIMHLFFGFLLCITIIGIPWGKQHFKMAGLSLAPFGKDVELGF